jgi:hypothetical protein
MKTLKLSTAIKQIKEGKFECVTDIKIGTVQIRTSRKKTTFINIING